MLQLNSAWIRGNCCNVFPTGSDTATFFLQLICIVFPSIAAVELYCQNSWNNFADYDCTSYVSYGATRLLISLWDQLYPMLSPSLWGLLNIFLALVENWCNFLSTICCIDMIDAQLIQPGWFMTGLNAALFHTAMCFLLWFKYEIIKIKVKYNCLFFCICRLLLCTLQNIYFIYEFFHTIYTMGKVCATIYIRCVSCVLQNYHLQAASNLAHT